MSSNSVPGIRIGGSELLRGALLSDEPKTRLHAEYIAPLMSRGPQRFMDNADVDLRVAICEGHLVPLVLSRSGRRNSEICDLRAHYIRYVPMQFERRGRPWAARVSRLRNVPAGILMTLGQLDRVVYINNFLVSTNPSLPLSTQQLRRLRDRLIELYPDRPLVVRSVNRRVDPAGDAAVRQAGFSMMRSRTVYLFDPASPEVHRRGNVKRDRKLLEQTHYRVVTDRDRLLAAVPRLTELYRGLYLGKHPSTNPAFVERFFAHLLEREIWAFVGFESDGVIDSFTSWFDDGGYLIGTAIGHDLNRPPSDGLYRLPIAYLLREGRRRGLRLNLSAGADEFKRSRGGRATHEFDAIYDRHLPLRSRLGLAYLRTASNRNLKKDCDA